MKNNDNENLYPHQNIFPNVKKFKEKLMAAQLCGANKNVMIYLQKLLEKI